MYTFANATLGLVNNLMIKTSIIWEQLLLSATFWYRKVIIKV